MKPLVERLKKTYAGKVEFRKYNVQTDPAAYELAGKLGVKYTPTFVFVDANGVIAMTVIGEQSEENMTVAVESLR